jgi:hypothetical protein
MDWIAFIKVKQALYHASTSVGPGACEWEGDQDVPMVPSCTNRIRGGGFVNNYGKNFDKKQGLTD